MTFPQPKIRELSRLSGKKWQISACDFISGGNWVCRIGSEGLEQQLIDLAYNKREYDLQKVLNDYVDYHYIDNYFLGVNPGCWLLTVNGVVVPQDKYKSVEDLANPANSPIGSEVIMYSLKKWA